MIRFGMNKKSNDPVNIELPFYYVKDGIYTPTKNLYICGPSRSFYRPNNLGRKIVWMETHGDIQTTANIPQYITQFTIHIDKKIIISEGKNPCKITTITGSNFYCDEFSIDNACSLMYDPYTSDTIYIKAYGNVIALE